MPTTWGVSQGPRGHVPRVQAHVHCSHRKVTPAGFLTFTYLQPRIRHRLWDPENSTNLRSSSPGCQVEALLLILRWVGRYFPLADRMEPRPSDNSFQRSLFSESPLNPPPLGLLYILGWVMAIVLPILDHLLAHLFWFLLQWWKQLFFILFPALELWLKKKMSKTYMYKD